MDVLTLGRFTPSWPKLLVATDESQLAEIMPLHEALALDFLDDRHFTAYLVPGFPRRLGMNERGDRSLWGWVEEGAEFCSSFIEQQMSPIPGVRVELFIVDVDAGNHQRDDEWDAAEEAKLEKLLADRPRTFVYETTNGYRLVWRLPSLFLIRTAADRFLWRTIYKNWLAYLRHRYGIVGDTSCADWTRIFRLPHATRDGVLQQRAVIGDPCNVGVWNVPMNASTRDRKEALAKGRAASHPIVVGEPKWEAKSLDIRKAVHNLKLYADSKRFSEDDEVRRRAELVRRVVAGDPLTDEIGEPGIGRHGSLHKVMQIIGHVLPDIGPDAAVEIVTPSIDALETHEPKGRAHYLRKAAEDYVEGVKHLMELRERKKQSGERVDDQLAEQLNAGRDE